MRTHEELWDDVSRYVHHLAESRPSNMEIGFLTGNQQVNNWTTYDKAYWSVMSRTLSKIGREIASMQERGEVEVKQEYAVKVFSYIFNKSFDLAYYTFDGENKVSFNMDEIVNDYELGVSPSLRLKLDEIKPKIVLIAKEMYQFMREEGYMKLALEKWLYYYMGAATSIGLSFLLEQEL